MTAKASQPPDWSADEIALLLTLRGRSFSAREISRVLARSRSAVCGKIFRLGLSTPRPGREATPATQYRAPYRPGIDPRPVWS